MKKFWNWIRDDAGGRVLRLEGPIDEDDFWGSSVTPKAFRDDLMAEDGDITIWINSPGGSVWAAAEIYNLIKDYPGAVTVKIDALAASAASVVAMAGDRVLMSPVGMLMLHDPSTIAMGNARDMEKAIDTLNEVKESIINAYAMKTGLSRKRISTLMSDETWINAKKAVELGFADEILYNGEDSVSDDGEVVAEACMFSAKRTAQTIHNRMRTSASTPDGIEAEPTKEEQPTPDEKPALDNSPAPDEEPATQTTAPSIGMDGKTETGAMPYELLMNQLDFLR